MLTAGLNAHRRGGGAGELTSRHSRLRQALQQSWLDTVTGTVGDALPPSRRSSEAALMLLSWGLSQLRPDRQSGFGGIDEHAWLHSTSWRPLLAIACHHGLLNIPAFPSRYRRRVDEAAVENLCGLWSVGHSTLYRYLDKGRRQLADVFATPPTGPQRLSLRWHVQACCAAGAVPEGGWATWHRSQANAAVLAGAINDALWHLWRAADLPALLDALQRYGTESAGSTEVDGLLNELESGTALTVEQRFEVALRWALLWRYRHDSAREEESLMKALRCAREQGGALLIGVAHASIARFHELRDRDRAFASYEEGIEQLRKAIADVDGDHRQRAVHVYADSIVRLAWLHLRQNNARAKSLLDQVQRMDEERPLPGDVVAPLEQTWGEYWRCVGDTRRALEHKHRALIVYERLGDQRAVLNTYRNLSLIYGEARDFERALEYGHRVIEAAKALVVEPEVLAGAHGNLGVAHFYRGEIDRAIEEYQQALQIEHDAGLRTHIGMSHYNLAEAYYHRFQKSHDQADEVQGDRHAASAARISAQDNARALNESARSLKLEVLGSASSPDRLLPGEYVAHFDEMAEIDRLRAALAVPHPPEQQVRAHLAIARAYLAIATKEREAALALVARHGLSEDFNTEIDALRQTFQRELTREQQWESRWQQMAGELLQPTQRSAALGRLMTAGAINKSGYAEVCGVSLATASKHLGLLAERGLLVQTGKGPSTRYLLPDSLN